MLLANSHQTKFPTTYLGSQIFFHSEMEILLNQLQNVTSFYRKKGTLGCLDLLDCTDCTLSNLLELYVLITGRTI